MIANMRIRSDEYLFSPSRSTSATLVRLGREIVRLRIEPARARRELEWSSRTPGADQNRSAVDYFEVTIDFTASFQVL